jgi:hypothetical protein
LLLERLERLLVPRAAVTDSWLRRALRTEAYRRRAWGLLQRLRWAVRGRRD